MESRLPNGSRSVVDQSDLRVLRDQRSYRLKG
jgi:hypothetical protein